VCSSVWIVPGNSNVAFARWCAASAIHCNTRHHTAPHCNKMQHAVTRCYSLQHTATHCDTPKHNATHTATHYDELQHTATHCNTLQHTATHCNMLRHIKNTMPNICNIYCNILPHTATQSHTHMFAQVQRTASHLNTLQHIATHGNTLQHTSTLTRRQRGGVEQACSARAAHVCCNMLQYVLQCVVVCCSMRCST